MELNKKLNTECGERLKQCIKDYHITQKELANKANFSVQYISNIINGKKPMTIIAAKQFSKVLKVSESYLLCESNFKTEKEKYLYDDEHATHIRNCINYLIESNGYKYVGDFVSNWDTISFEPYMNIRKYSDIVRLELTDSEFYNPIYEKMKFMSEIETPSGERIICTFDELLVTMDSIQRFAMFAMETLRANSEQNKKHLSMSNDNNRVNRHELTSILFPDVKPET